MKARTNIYIDKKVKKQATKKAADCKRSFSAHVEYLLEKDLKGKND